MDTLNGIDCFVRSAEAGSFAEAARQLGLTPAAVGKNVAKLEQLLGVRLFQRSTRSLSLTEAGRQFLAESADSLTQLQTAIANLATAQGRAAGLLKISLAPSFGRNYVVPILAAFMDEYPQIVPDLRFSNRAVDLVSEGFDVAIGGGFDVSPSLVARELAPAHLVLLASREYLERNPAISKPSELAAHSGILIRSPQSGRVLPRILQGPHGKTLPLQMQTRMTLDDPEAACAAVLRGLGITLVAMAHAIPFLERGETVRVLPEWFVVSGTINIYFSARKLLSRKTRVFVDYIVDEFRRQNLSERLSANIK